MKKISILGSTGSIGRQAVDLVLTFPDRFQVTALSAAMSVEMLAGQVRKLHPVVVAVSGQNEAKKLSGMIGDCSTKVLFGDVGLKAVAAESGAELVISSIMGIAGFRPTLEAVKAGKTVALANKESLVAGGELICAEAAKSGSKILPVDSEHSAIFQSMLGHNRDEIRRLILTASGGPFLGLSPRKLSKVKPAQALRHPRWKMGNKITIDSATMMNKGFEVIEAMWLFGIPLEKIEILIHKQSAIHSMVEYIDGSVVAQMGIADMRIPIAYALSYPSRLPLGLPRLDLCEIGSLTFQKPDPRLFPAYTLAYQAAKAGGTAPAVLCAADEAVVEAFLKGRIRFTEMAEIMKKVLESHVSRPVDSPETVLEAAAWAGQEAEKIIKQ